MIMKKSFLFGLAFMFLVLLMSMQTVDAQCVGLNCTSNVTITVIVVELNTTCIEPYASTLTQDMQSSEVFVQYCQGLSFNEQAVSLTINTNSTIRVPIYDSDRSDINSTEEAFVTSYITIISPNGTVIVDRATMSLNNSYLSYDVDGSLIDTIGEYKTSIYSTRINDKAFTEFGTMVTYNGRPVTQGSYIFMIILIFVLFAFLIWLNIKFNQEARDKLFKKIVIDYIAFKKNRTQNNLAYAILYAVGYGMLRSMFVFYYLVLLIMLLVMTEYVNLFNIQSLVGIFTSLLAVYLWGLLIVCIVWLMIIFELIRELIGAINKNMRGVATGW